MAGKEDAPEIFGMRFGNVDVEIDTSKMVVRRCKEMHRAYCRIKSANDDMIKFPKNPGQSLKDWREEHKDDVDEDFYARNSGDSPEEHVLKMQLKLTPQTGIEIFVPLLNDFLKILHRPDGVSEHDQEYRSPVEISELDFESTRWKKAKNFMFKICKEASVPAIEYFPS